MKTQSAAEFLSEALTHVESASIREWAISEHNYPLWIKLAGSNRKLGAVRLATYIVTTAIGL